MSFPRSILLLTVTLFSIIGVVSLLKKDSGAPIAQNIYEIELEEVKEKQEVAFLEQEPVVEEMKPEPPEADQIHRLFALGSSKLSIVDTITYTSRVPWLPGRAAWVADYAAYYGTTRHFIARSLNKKPDYFTQKVALGDKFNVLKKDLDLEFYLVVDLSRSKLWFYYLDKTNHEHMLLKTYDVGVGREDSSKESKSLTPLGKYRLGEKVAIYKEGTKGYFQDQKIEMLQVFGTRWIPFSEEVGECTEPAKGYGLHGAPWKKDSHSGKLKEDVSGIGIADSDGCIRLASQDIEELFSIIITKPTTVEIVKDYFEAELPFKEN